MIVNFLLPKWTNLPSGGYKVVYLYANHLVSRGHTVYITFSAQVDYQNPGLVFRALNFGRYLRYKYLPGPEITWYPLHEKVKPVIASDLSSGNVPDADIVIATSWKTAKRANVYPDVKGEKVYFIQSYEIWSGPEDEVAGTWRMGFKKIVIARWLEDIARNMGEEVLAYIPNAIDLDTFRVTRQIKDRDPFCVGLLFHESPVKGSKEALAALELAKTEVPELNVKMFGTFAKPALPPWITYSFNPSVATLVELYNSCAIFICASFIEGWPLPPAEAIACGAALVGTDIGGLGEYAIQEKTALLSPSGQPGAMAKNLVELLKNQQKRITLANNANEYISRFSWDRARSMFEAALEEAVSAKT